MSESTTEAPRVTWSILAEPQGAVLTEAGALQDFGDPDGERRMALGDGAAMPLPGAGLVRVVGDDAADFLHAQLTQSVDDMDAGEWRWSGYCNPKGRLYAVMQVVRLEADDFILVTDGTVTEALVRRLRMFVLRSRVALQEVSPHMAAIGVTGATATALTEIAGSLPRKPGGVVHSGDLSVLDLGGEPQRYLLLAHAGDAGGVWDALARGSRPALPDAWRLLAIRNGEPRITATTTEEHIPQQVNLDLIQGVHFRKGCYPGQEIIARMHYRGKPSRRMFRLSVLDDTAPEAGTTVTLGDGGTAGQIVDAVTGPKGVEALAALKVAHAGRQDLRCGDAPASFLELPYAIPETEPEAPETPDS